MEIVTYKRKLHHIGGSLLVALPQAWLRNYGLEERSEVYVGINKEGEVVIKHD